MQPHVAFMPASIISLPSLVFEAIAPALLWSDRKEAETNEFFKHLVTYTVINRSGSVVSYRRGKSGGEGRLHDLRSIGVGGHVNPSDMIDGYLSVPAIHAAARREIDEECTHGDGHLVYVGALSDDSNPVGRVHLGLVFEFRTLDPVRPREKCLEDMTYDSQYALSQLPDGRLESWSEILARHAMGPPRSTFFH